MMDYDVRKRTVLCLEVKRAFEQVGVGAIIQNSPLVPYAVVTAYINHNSGWHKLGQGWQRRVLVSIPDECEEVSVFMTGLYRLPDGKSDRDVAIGEVLPLLFKLSRHTPGWLEEIVSQVRQASQASMGTIEVKVIQPLPPPVALENLTALGDLIDVHEKYYFTTTENAARIVGNA